MTRLGKYQKEIVEKMKVGGTLFNEQGVWSLREVDNGPWYVVNRERCMSLFVRGIVMGADIFNLPGGRWRQAYVLTEKGKAL